MTALCEESSLSFLPLKYSLCPKELTAQMRDNAKWGPATRLTPGATPAKEGFEERLWDISMGAGKKTLLFL